MEIIECKCAKCGELNPINIIKRCAIHDVYSCDSCECPQCEGADSNIDKNTPKQVLEDALKGINDGRIRCKQLIVIALDDEYEDGWEFYQCNMTFPEIIALCNMVSLDCINSISKE